MSDRILKESGNIEDSITDLRAALQAAGYASLIAGIAFKDWADVIRAKKQVTSSQQTLINAACIETEGGTAPATTALETYLASVPLMPTELQICGQGSEHGEKIDMACITDAMYQTTPGTARHLDDMRTLFVRGIDTLDVDRFKFGPNGVSLTKIVLSDINCIKRTNRAYAVGLRGLEEADFSGVYSIVNETSGKVFDSLDDVKVLKLDGLESYEGPNGEGDVFEISDVESLEKLVIGGGFGGKISVVDTANASLRDVKMPYYGSLLSAIQATVSVASGAVVSFLDDALGGRTLNESGTLSFRARYVTGYDLVWFEMKGSVGVLGLDVKINGSVVAHFEKTDGVQSASTTVSGHDVYMNVVKRSDGNRVLRMGVCLNRASKNIAFSVGSDGNMTLSITAV